MPSPLAFLFGLGQGATALGTDMQQQDAFGLQNRRLVAQDALNRLATISKLGLIPAGNDPTATLQGIQNRNTQRSMLQNAPGAGAFSGGVDYSQYGNPSVVNLPTATGANESYVMDPSRTPEALQEQRAGTAQDATYRRGMDVENQRIRGAADLETQKEKAAAAKVHAAQVASYHALRTEFPKSPLAQLPADDNTDYAAALGYERSKALQASAYHPPPAEWENSGAVDKATGEPIYINKATLERRTLSGAMPKPAGGGGSGQGAQTSLPDLLRTHLAMSASPVESDPSFSITYPQEVREGSNYGLQQQRVKGQPPSVGQALLGGTMNLFTHADPNVVSYMQNGRAWGEDASNAWKGRTNEERVIRDINTGTLNSSNQDIPQVKQQLQQRRQNVIAMTAIANPKQFDALDPKGHALIQSYIDGLTPDQVRAAQQAAGSTASSGNLNQALEDYIAGRKGKTP